MNELAVQLNAALEDSCAYPFLSELGKRMYFPKGIVAQSDEAKEKAKRYNATVGLATSKGEPFYLSDIYSSSLIFVVPMSADHPTDCVPLCFSARCLSVCSAFFCFNCAMRF